MAVIFNQRVRHGKVDFHPGPVYAFEDPDAEPYFVAAGWASTTGDAPTVTISLDEIDIDPATIFGDGPRKGKRVIEGDN